MEDMGNTFYAEFTDDGGIVINGVAVGYVGDDAHLAATVNEMLGEDRYAGIVPIYLAIAKQAVRNRLFPMNSSKTWDDVPECYHLKACNIAVYLISKRGAEGEVNHAENGASRTYASADIPLAMLADVVPFVGIPR